MSYIFLNNTNLAKIINNSIKNSIINEAKQIHLIKQYLCY